MAPDLRLQGWTHGRARAQSEEEEKQRRGGQGREGVGFRARGVLSSPASLESSSPAATFQGHWEKALYSNKQGSPLSHDPRAALVGHTHPLRPTPPPTPRRKTQQAASQRCSLDLPMGAGLPFRSPRASPGPRAGEGTQAHTRVMDNMGLAPRFPGRDSQDGKGSHCLNPHSPSLSISCSQRKGRPFSSERWFQTAGRGF